jgi:hypothetical protein
MPAAIRTALQAETRRNEEENQFMNPAAAKSKRKLLHVYSFSV